MGKLIASKGVELLLAAWPLVLAAEPRARLVVVGFGAFREGLERLAAALDAGDLDAAAATRGEDGRALTQFDAFFARAPATATRRAGWRERVAFAGRLDHGELADLLPAAEAMAVTSTFPEAFGMVAAEAAACGALPVVANHSGLGEVARHALRRPSRSRRATGSRSSSARSRSPSWPPRSRAGWPRRTTSGPPRARRSSRPPAPATPGTGVARTVIAAARGDARRPAAALSYSSASSTELPAIAQQQELGRPAQHVAARDEPHGEQEQRQMPQHLHAQGDRPRHAAD